MQVLFLAFESFSASYFRNRPLAKVFGEPEKPAKIVILSAAKNLKGANWYE
jgi:hypothetical protein